MSKSSLLTLRQYDAPSPTMEWGCSLHSPDFIQRKGSCFAQPCETSHSSLGIAFQGDFGLHPSCTLQNRCKREALKRMSSQALASLTLIQPEQSEPLPSGENFPSSWQILLILQSTRYSELLKAGTLESFDPRYASQNAPANHTYQFGYSN